ncbi:hypothetical protein G6F23_007329 [Rhizopus arrhizus]|nr:hypothetical protein G6F23_007329 [Rhizopus arrhizus]
MNKYPELKGYRLNMNHASIHSSTDMAKYIHTQGLISFPEGFTAFNSARLLKVPVHYVFASLSSTLTSEVKESVVPLNSECATSVIVEGTHMLPCEVPDLLVPEVMKLISRVNNMKEASKL